MKVRLSSKQIGLYCTAYRIEIKIEVSSVEASDSALYSFAMANGHNNTRNGKIDSAFLRPFDETLVF